MVLQSLSDGVAATWRLNRDYKISKKNLISQAQLDQSRNQRDSAKFQEQLAEVNLKKSVVRSPIRGQV